MNDRSPPCADFEEDAAELALGYLPEPRRSDLLHHASGCPRCRRLLDELSLSADRVLLAADEVEPPPGFETRVLAHLGVGPGRARRRRLPVAAALVATALAAGAIGVVIGRSVGDSGEGSVAGTVDTAGLGGPAAHVGRLINRSGDEVGLVTVAGGEHPVALFQISRWGREDAVYRCLLVLADGALHDAGSWAAGSGRTWAVDLPAGIDVVGARMLVGDREWATAELH